MTIGKNGPQMKCEPWVITRLKALGIPEPETEYKFCPDRRWRIDYCWPQHKLAVEIEGGVWNYGRHNRAVSFLKDMEKYNKLALMGFSLLRFTPQQWGNGEAALTIQKWFDCHQSIIKEHGQDPT